MFGSLREAGRSTGSTTAFRRIAQLENHVPVDNPLMPPPLGVIRGQRIPIDDLTAIFEAAIGFDANDLEGHRA